MLITLITWLLMLFIFSAVGVGINKIINKYYSKNKSTCYDIIWYGIVCVTAYAQCVSLFYKVGKLAFIIMLLTAVVLVYFFREEYLKNIKKSLSIDFSKQYEKIVLKIVGCVIVIVALVFTVQVAGHYDTNLYHAQNIRWIEEYGIVKGLGNLHNRFAYNSAFMCLQALFSFSWCTSQSLHTLNGFLWVFMASYAIRTLKIYKEKKLYASDVFKMLMLFYLCNNDVIYYMSSPHTDMMTLVMVLYIVIRWNELLEDNYQGYMMYGILCLLGVSAVSIKLSAAMVLILVLKPAIHLLREKKWKVIGIFIGIGVLIITPFLLRNIVISGYLVYPYPEIDLFHVDWKMEEALVIHDKHEIIVWGRMLNDPAKYDEPITAWLPIWMESSGMFYSSLMVLNMSLLPISAIVIAFYLRKKQYDQSLMLACVEVLYLGWLLTSPLPRYGLVYLFIAPVYYMVTILRRIYIKFKKAEMLKVAFTLCMFLIAVKPCWNTLKKIEATLKEYVIMPADYNNNFKVDIVEWEGIKVYVPSEGDRGTYADFPGTPYADRLNKTEFREEDMSGGFRLRGE